MPYCNDLAASALPAGVLLDAACSMAATDPDSMTHADADCFSVTERGRPFVRAIAGQF